MRDAPHRSHQWTCPYQRLRYARLSHHQHRQVDLLQKVVQPVALQQRDVSRERDEVGPFGPGDVPQLVDGRLDEPAALSLPPVPPQVAEAGNLRGERQSGTARGAGQRQVTIARADDLPCYVE